MDFRILIYLTTATFCILTTAPSASVILTKYIPSFRDNVLIVVKADQLKFE